MPDSQNEPSLTPSADTPGEKREKARAGKGVAAILGAIAVVFIIFFVGVFVFGGFFGATH
ncbi:hypothetical protein HGP17_09235 [Rhizobium sp. P38BS-XIX]|uniref:hypothetical protein n=1 Tax=Rhizobium sp. P38BS-XIX TaxID=2726740 RepID=UPI0014567789|nr:hypothetical protein [Rhizobium sp. P38BS-XIX]NLR97018.1 hypothetical protein [Rhizobium sp. P38BS-XIX]